MAPGTWQQQLEQCRSEREVILAARDFIASLTPADIAALPHGCVPGKMMAVDDVCAYALDVLRHDRSLGAASGLVQRIAQFFCAATVQLARLAAEPVATARASEPARRLSA